MQQVKDTALRTGTVDVQELVFRCYLFRHAYNMALWIAMRVRQQAFFTADILTYHSEKSTDVLIPLTMALVYTSVPVNHDSVTVSQRAQYQDLKVKQLNEIQPSLVFLLTPVLLLL